MYIVEQKIFCKNDIQFKKFKKIRKILLTEDETNDMILLVSGTDACDYLKRSCGGIGIRARLRI